ncbi:MAG: MBL fold metallo-hydrolase [Clostridiales Family XIII bacterium]|jgi:glyoxylase-like metal-dependent hydrolase (beta-lactamase superfamily II)|nr:MBL fold metallo-hydrolase [Clostridiales Family XIII bacterium]
MEIRKHVHGKGKLWTLTCISRDSGFRVASVIIMGKEEAIVIDTQWTLSNAHRVVAELLEAGKKLKSIFLTHAHPDHYFGTEVFLNAYPEAKVYALEEDIPTIHAQLFPKLEHWEKEIGVLNCPHKEFSILPLQDGHLELDGERIEIHGKVWGDLKYNSKVWIPSIKTVVCSDIVFSGAHPFTCEVSAKGRRNWLAELENIRSMGADVIIPGHATENMPFDETGLDFTRDYLLATEEELAKKPTVEAFFYNIEKRFFGAKLRKSNEMNANVMCGDREWWPEGDED